MPDKRSDGIKRLTVTKPVKAHRKLELGSERPGSGPVAKVTPKRPPRNKG